jgi:hypothetical protein
VFVFVSFSVFCVCSRWLVFVFVSSSPFWPRLRFSILGLGLLLWCLTPLSLLVYFCIITSWYRPPYLLISDTSFLSSRDPLLPVVVIIVLTLYSLS